MLFQLFISHLEVAWHPGEREAAYKRAAWPADMLP
jgi:hypothetical protein